MSIHDDVVDLLVNENDLLRTYDVLSERLIDDVPHIRHPVRMLLSEALRIHPGRADVIVSAHPYLIVPSGLTIEEVELYLRMVMTRHPIWKVGYRFKTTLEEEKKFRFKLSWGETVLYP